MPILDNNSQNLGLLDTLKERGFSDEEINQFIESTKKDEEDSLLDMSDPESHPSWAKEVNSKYGMNFASNRSPASSPSPKKDIHSMSYMFNEALGRNERNPVDREKAPYFKEIDKTEQDIRNLNQTIQTVSSAQPERASEFTPKLVELFNKLKDLREKQKTVLDKDNKYVPEYTPDFGYAKPSVPPTPAATPSPAPALAATPSPVSAPVVKPPVVARAKPTPVVSAREPSSDFDLDALLNSKAVSSTNKDPMSFLNSPPKTYGEKISPAIPPAVSVPLKEEDVSLDSSMQEPLISEEEKAQIEKDAEEKFRKEDEQKAQETEATKDAVRGMQGEANMLRLMQSITDSASQLGAGIAGAMSGYNVTPVKSKFFGDRAEQIGKDYLQRVAVEKDDPNSQYTKSFRKFAKPLAQQAGYDPKIIDDMVGSQINALLPGIQDKYEAELRIKAAEIARRESRADRQQRQKEIDFYKEQSLNQRKEEKANARFDRFTKDEVARIQGAERPLEVIQKIRVGDIKGAQNIREQLNAEVSALLMPAGMRPSVSGLNRTQIDTYYGRLKDLVGKIKGGPEDSIPAAYLDQIEKEVVLLQNAYRNALKDKVSSMKKGTSDEYVKSIFEGRASDFLSNENDDEEAIKWAKEHPEDPRAKEILQYHGL